MNKEDGVKKVFPGGNTAKGFYSYYDHIIGADAARLFIIKGGPGVGKSFFMKKIGLYMKEKGYDIEFHQCSSDEKSLDGVVIPALKIAIIDGTTPHMVDPKYPGGVDEILNFGEFWNEENISKHKEEIVVITSKISKLFQRAYRFLAAANVIRDDIELIYEEALDKGRFNLAITKLRSEVLGGIPYSMKEGRIRKLFGSAYSPNGLVDYYETIIGPAEKVIYIQGSYVGGISRILEQIVDEAIKKGLFIEAYHEPMVATNIETILIPELSLAVTASKKYAQKNTKIFNLDQLMKIEVLEEYREVLEEDQNLVDELLFKGLSNIAAAKQEHDLLETFYIENMNFDKLDQLREKTIKKIMNYTE